MVRIKTPNGWKSGKVSKRDPNRPKNKEKYESKSKARAKLLEAQMLKDQAEKAVEVKSGAENTGENAATELAADPASISKKELKERLKTERREEKKRRAAEKKKRKLEAASRVPGPPAPVLDHDAVLKIAATKATKPSESQPVSRKRKYEADGLTDSADFVPLEGAMPTVGTAEAGATPEVTKAQKKRERKAELMRKLEEKHGGPLPSAADGPLTKKARREIKKTKQAVKREEKRELRIKKAQAKRAKLVAEQRKKNQEKAAALAAGTTNGTSAEAVASLDMTEAKQAENPVEEDITMADREAMEEVEDATADDDQSTQTASTSVSKSQKEKSKKPQHRFVLFAGNLPFSTTTIQLEQHFAAFKPTSIRHMSHPDDDSAPAGKRGVSKGWAFVEFGSWSTMKSCMEKLHNSEINDDKGKPRKINLELTAGGGGKGDNRKEKLKEKNSRLKDQRKRKAEAREEEKKVKGDIKAAQAAQSEPEAVNGIHPSRQARVQT